ncbi:hypothetical protein CH63R_04047 [Colletotrichum higginsianum IMI 349063]|uniref:Uncharacterized protein n=1 Tax=Colletotrichum higginsianum (strain IMI 349063) TaxID=759273 RepID=A0A1B7YHX0_COLHI|nr:hypothetical protein CH63R_04047 [Colletotrichum higginsianum IMI 349063]OBR11751.1 hypothetical protein CH63R_04047 [Colletotrichum higginsianum IMI 349063]
MTKRARLAREQQQLRTSVPQRAADGRMYKLFSIQSGRDHIDLLENTARATHYQASKKQENVTDKEPHLIRDCRRARPTLPSDRTTTACAVLGPNQARLEEYDADMSSARRYAALSIRIHPVSIMSPRVDEPPRDQKRSGAEKDSTFGWRARRLMATRDIVTEQPEDSQYVHALVPPECSCEGRSFPPPPSNLCRLGAWAVHVIAERQSSPLPVKAPSPWLGYSCGGVGRLERRPSPLPRPTM